MSYQEGPTRGFPNNAALSKGIRVVLSAGYLAAASASQVALGTMEYRALSTNEQGTVRLRTAPGTQLMVASGAITAGNPVYAAASGKVAASGTVYCGTALEAATADGDLIEVLPGPNTDLSALNTQTLTAAADSGAGSTITAGTAGVNVTAVATDANDWIVLPAIADVPIGHTIRIAANAGSNFELRTPAASNTKINDVDSDGTQEYLVTSTDLVIVTKLTTTAWVAQSITKLGAVRTAVVPD
jgi:hypothetical protein